MGKRYKETRYPPKEFSKYYWCPECGKLVKANMESINFSIDYDEDIIVHSADIDFNIVCLKCDGYMIPIDYLLGKQIKRLNELGAETVYCCSGHLTWYRDISTNRYNYNITLPYICFYHDTANKQVKDIVKGLLSLQEYMFIDYSEDAYKWRIGVSNCDKPNFNNMRTGFIRFINELIDILEGEG